MPTKTHIRYWCRLCSIVPTPDFPDNEHQARRVRIFRSLVEDVDTTLTVDGERVVLLSEAIRPDEIPERGIWNITDPLSSGIHTVTLTLAFESDANSPPPCITYPNDAVVP